jgi:hypothetical protein
MEHLFKAGGGGEPGIGARLVLGAVEFNPESVARVLLRQALKAHVEWSRGLTLSRGGYAQLQVDLAAIHLALPFFLHAKLPPLQESGRAGSGGSAAPAWDPYSGGLSLEELVREAAVSAAERCVEARPLEAAILLDVAGAKLRSLDLVSALP